MRRIAVEFAVAHVLMAALVGVVLDRKSVV